MTQIYNIVETNLVTNEVTEYTVTAEQFAQKEAELAANDNGTEYTEITKLIEVK
jgi:hypothetical protein